MGMFAFTAEYQQRQEEVEKERLAQIAKFREYKKPAFNKGELSNEKVWEVEIQQKPPAKKPVRRSTKKPAD